MTFSSEEYCFLSRQKAIRAKFKHYLSYVTFRNDRLITCLLLLYLAEFCTIVHHVRGGIQTQKNFRLCYIETSIVVLIEFD